MGEPIKSFTLNLVEIFLDLLPRRVCGNARQFQDPEVLKQSALEELSEISTYYLKRSIMSRSRLVFKT